MGIVRKKTMVDEETPVPPWLGDSQKAMDRLDRLFGERDEGVVIPLLPEKFRAFGYAFSKSSQNTVFVNAALDSTVEIDGFLEDEDCCMAVDVNRRLKEEHIAIFIRRLERIRRFMDIRQDTRRLYGAIGGTASADSEVRGMILGKGFYLIEPSGEDVVVTPPPSAPIPY